jgi:hypothetical protein
MNSAVEWLFRNQAGWVIEPRGAETDFMYVYLYYKEQDRGKPAGKELNPKLPHLSYGVDVQALLSSFAAPCQRPSRPSCILEDGRTADIRCPQSAGLISTRSVKLSSCNGDEAAQIMPS